jgi:hypothetical protein
MAHQFLQDNGNDSTTGRLRREDRWRKTSVCFPSLRRKEKSMALIVYDATQSVILCKQQFSLSFGPLPYLRIRVLESEERKKRLIELYTSHPEI